jgi:hypothetical protein
MSLACPTRPRCGRSEPRITRVIRFARARARDRPFQHPPPGQLWHSGQASAVTQTVTIGEPSAPLPSATSTIAHATSQASRRPVVRRPAWPRRAVDRLPGDPRSRAYGQPTEPGVAPEAGPLVWSLPPTQCFPRSEAHRSCDPGACSSSRIRARSSSSLGWPQSRGRSGKAEELRYRYGKKHGRHAHQPIACRGTGRSRANRVGGSLRILDRGACGVRPRGSRRSALGQRGDAHARSRCPISACPPPS